MKSLKAFVRTNRVDENDDYGCTSMNAVDGDYHYDFCGCAEAGPASNHMEITVTVSGS